MDLANCRTRAQKRLIQEDQWYRQGVEDESNGAELKDWPRSERKYSNEWYRMKACWQDGWLNSRNGTPNKELAAKSIPDTLFYALRDTPTIRLRSLLERFSSTDRPLVKAVLDKWVELGEIRLTGQGTRLSPKMVEKI